MSYFQMAHFDWLESAGIECSPFGREVAYIIGCTFCGIYNAPIEHDEIEWKNERSLSITIDRELATFDYNNLTNLTLFAHEMCIRISISPVVKFKRWDSDQERSVLVGICDRNDDIPEDSQYCNPCLEIWFHKRGSRDGGMSARHPTIEQAVERFKSACSFPTEFLPQSKQSEEE